MRYDADTDHLTLSATDLASHQRCERLVQLDRQRAIAVARGEVEPDDADTLAARKGREFEDRVVAELLAETAAAGRTAVDLRGDELDPRERRAALEAAIRAGAHVIVQAPLRTPVQAGAGSLGGFADLLLRTECDGAEPAGSLATLHRYEPVEIKYARSVRPAFVLQCCAYAAVLERLCGEAPAALHVWTGDGARHTFDAIDFAAHYRAAAERLQLAVAEDLDEALAPTPPKITHCGGCRWEAECGARRRAVDHPSLVANIRRTQVDRLAGEGITTVAGLAAAIDLDGIGGIGAATLERLQEQARLQVAARAPGALPGWSFREPDRPGRGFALLPAPDAADMFFDFEGYPYHELGALEYLWGWTEPQPGAGFDGQRQPSAAAPGASFVGIWCDTLEEEAAAFAEFLAHVTARRAANPGMHVYHYAPYEITQLKRLADLHPEHWPALAPLLSGGVFVDLYAVVSQAMLIGTESYSIKYLEPLYGFGREDADVATAGASIDEYERWADTGDVAVRDAIIHYNRDDCDSTLALRDWLLERRSEAAGQGIEWPPEATRPDDDGDDDEGDPAEEDAELLAERVERGRLVDILRAAADGDLPGACDHFDDELRADVSRAARLAAAMPGWGWRERSQFLGELHGMKHARRAEDFELEADAMGSLTLLGEEQLTRGTVIRHYRGPVQDSLIKADQNAWDPLLVLPLGKVEQVDAEQGTISIRTTAAPQAYIDSRGGIDWHDVGAILGRTEVSPAPLEQRARDVGAELAAALDAGEDPFTREGGTASAALALLARRLPVVAQLEPGEPMQEGGAAGQRDAPPTPVHVANLVQGLEHSALVIQGPPGTGKTWVTARAIAELVDRGLRVGITSNSHAAIRHLIAKLDEHLTSDADAPAGARGLRVAYAPGRGDAWDDSPGRVTLHRSSGAARTAFAHGEAEVLAGTAWLFAKMEEPVDAIFVDEAGQLSLLHATAIAAATTRLVLVGDPQQLAQPSPVAHPEAIERSPLDLVFDGERTLPPERGLLLPVTRRMHPDVVGWISDAFYDGRVEAYEPTGHHRIECPSMPALSGAGLRFAPTPHEGCSTYSAQEAERIAAVIDALLDPFATVVDHDAVTGAATAPRALTRSDIVVVAPYNRQVSRLRDLLPAGTRIGTVDRFQGREAAVAIWSVTASSADDVPRGLEFLLSANRMNVAISRARALAIVVASPALLATRCTTIEEMRLVNRLQLFAERADAVSEQVALADAP